jgi:hypothetical protein
MQSEHRVRRRRKRRWTIGVSIYWIVVVGVLLLGFDWLVTSGEPLTTKWLIGIVGAALGGLLVHWGVMQTVALRQG